MIARQLQLPLLLLLLVVSFNDAFIVRQGKREAGAAPTYASAVAPPSRPFTTTTLSMASDTLQEAESMRIGELKKELESYGISTKTFLEKSELVDAVKKARDDGLEPKKTTTTTTTTTTAEPKTTTTSASSSSSSSTADKRPREERLKEEMEKCQTMKNAELKKELTERGISTTSFFEKSEFVKALAEARVDGVTKKAASSSSGGRSSAKVDEEGYVEIDNVEVLTADDAGPRPRGQQQSQQQQSPFGGGAGGNPFGGAAGGAGGMGGMGGIADMLRNMGMGGAAAGGGNPFAGGAGAAGANPFGGGANPFGGMGGMGGMGDAMGQAQEMMKNPKVMEIMMKAQRNPKVMAAMQDVMSNPANIGKYQNDPEVAELMNELKKFM